MTTATKKVTVLDVIGDGGLLSKHLPGYESRPAQVKTANLIEQALENRDHVVVELATGGGKSVAALVPSMVAGVTQGEKIVYSTAVKALQEQIADKDAPFLAQVLEPIVGRPIRYAVLKGRGNYLCLKAVEAVEQSGAFRSPLAAETFPSLLNWMEEQRWAGEVADIETFPGFIPNDLRQDVVTSTDECTGDKCKFYSECFAESAKTRAKNADIVITNHKLTMMDALVRQTSDAHAAVLPDYSILILDEAHAIESIARDSFGFEITPNRIDRLVHMVERLTVNHPGVANVAEKPLEAAQAETWNNRVQAAMAAINDYAATIRTKLERNQDAREMRLGDERLVRLGGETLFSGIGEDTRPTMEQAVLVLKATAEEFEQATPAWLEGDDRELWRKVGSQMWKLSSELKTIITPGTDSQWVRRAKLDGEGTKVRVVLDAKPVDVSNLMTQHFFGDVTKVRMMTNEDGEEVPVESVPALVVVALSATIAADGTMEMWRTRNGVIKALEMVQGSPFDFKKNALMYLPGDAQALTPVQKGKPGYDEYVEALCAHMEGLTLDAKGGAFLLFTSRSMMNIVHERIAGNLEAAGLLVMKQGEGSRQRQVADFKSNGNAVLFGLKTFWEGVDIQGSALRLVAIDKMPFNPPSDVVWSALCDHINRQRGNDMAAFNELGIPTAIIALKQGVGRLIRSKTDFGIMALLDGRVRTKRYGKRILGNMPDSPITSDPERVREFFARRAVS